MRYNKLILLVLWASVAVACTKQPGQDGQGEGKVVNNSGRLLKLVTTTTSLAGVPQSTSVEYAYDAQGRVTEVVEDFKSYKYAYGNGTLKVSGRADGVQNFTLDAAGRATRLEVKNNILNKLEYDNDGYLAVNYVPGDTQYFVYSNGDMVQQLDNNRAPYAEFTYTGIVWDDKLNKPVLDFDMNSLLLGRGNKHIVAGVKFTNGDYEVFTHTLNKQGKPETITLKKYNKKNQAVDFKQVEFAFTWAP